LDRGGMLLRAPSSASFPNTVGHSRDFWPIDGVTYFGRAYCLYRGAPREIRSREEKSRISAGSIKPKPPNSPARPEALEDRRNKFPEVEGKGGLFASVYGRTEGKASPLFCGSRPAVCAALGIPNYRLIDGQAGYSRQRRALVALATRNIFCIFRSTGGLGSWKQLAGRTGR